MAKYIFEEKEYDGITSLLKDIENEFDIENEYDDMLDNLYGDIEICGNNYFASLALFKVDETAYRCGKCDYESEVMENIEFQIKNLSKGEIYEGYSIEVECVEDDHSD